MDPLVAQGATRMFAGTFGGQSPIATPLNLDGFPSRRREAAAECEGFPRFVGRSGQTNNTIVGPTQLLVAPRPPGVARGDWLIAAGFHTQDVQFDSPGWVEIAHASGGSGRVTMLYKIAGSSEPATYTFTSHSAFQNARVAVAAYRGVIGLGQVHVTGAPAAVANVATLTGLTALERNDALVIVATGCNTGSSRPVALTDKLCMDSLAAATGYAAIGSAQLPGGGPTGNYRLIENGGETTPVEYVMTTLVGCGRFNFGVDDIITEPVFIGATHGFTDLGVFDITLTYPAGSAAGDLAVVMLAHGNGVTFSPHFSWGVGWAGIDWRNDDPGPSFLNGFRFIESGETSATFTVPGPSGVVLTVYRNVDTRVPLAQRGVRNAGNSALITALGITATAHNRVAFHCANRFTITAPPAGWTTEGQQNPAGGSGQSGAFIAGKTVASSGPTGDVTATQSATTWAAELVEFNALHTPV